MSLEMAEVVVLRKGQSLRDYEESFVRHLPVPIYRYSIEDLSEGCNYRTITCWKNGKTVFDVSRNHDELMESWAIHEGWHQWQSERAPQSDEESNLCQVAYLESLTEDQRLAEFRRSERMSEFFDDVFRRAN